MAKTFKSIPQVLGTRQDPVASTSTDEWSGMSLLKAIFSLIGESSLGPLGALTPAADKLPYFTGASTAGLADFTAFARELLNDADAAAARMTLGALASSSYSAVDVLAKLLTVDGPGSGLNADTLDGIQGAELLTAVEIAAAYQPLDSDLSAIAALTTTSYGRSLLTVASSSALAASLGGSSGISVTAAPYNAAGDGVTDDTAAFQAAADNGGVINVPDGTYLLDEITISQLTHWRLSPGAVLKQRSSPDGHTRIFKFETGSNGSSVIGGIFDGDRATHEPFYISHGRTADYNTWEGLRSDDVDDLYIEDVVFRDFVTFGIRRANGNRHIWRNLKVDNCGQAIYAYGGEGHTIDGVLMTDINNGGTEVFQHGLELYALESSSVSNLSLIDFAGDSNGLEPLAYGAVVVRCVNTHFSGLSFRGYGGDLRNGAMTWNSMEQCTLSGLHSYGFESGLTLESCTDYTVTDFVLDGNFANVSANEMNGIWCTIGGTFDPNAASLAGETTANLSSRNGTIANGIVMRFSDSGVKNQSSDVTFDNVRSVGNAEFGFLQSEFASASNPWPDAFRRNVYNVTYRNCTASHNADGGFIATAGDRIIYEGCVALNNGQSLSGAYRNGIVLLADSSELGDVRVVNCRSEDTQTWTITDGISYLPGTYATQFEFSALSPDRLEIGQRVTLVDVLAASGDVTGTIVEREADIYTLYVGSSTTLVDNLQTIGTGSTTGTTVSIPAGLSYNLHFPVYLRHPSNGEYRRIAMVNSSTQATLASAFSSDIPGGSTLQVILADITGIPSQQYGISGNANITGPLYLKGNDFSSNVAGSYDLSAFPSTGYAAGSELDGNLYLEAGSASSPSYSRITDANTGMYFPGADQLGFATAGANRVFIAADGSVGIGTTSPDRHVHWEQTDSGTNNVVATSRSSRGSSGTVTTGFGMLHEMELENASGSMIIAAYDSVEWSDSTNASEDAVRKWAVITGGVLAEELGLHGTSLYPTTDAGLDLGGSSNRFASAYMNVLDLAAGLVGTPSLRFAGDMNTGIFSNGADQFSLVTAGVARQYLAADGSIGFGTTSPDRRFHWEQTDSGTNNLVATSRASRASSGTVTTGFGLLHEMELENASGSMVIAAYDSIEWSDSTNASEDVVRKWAVITGGVLADELGLHGTALYPTTNSGLDLGGSSNQFANLYISGTFNRSGTAQPTAGRTVIASGSLSGSVLELEDIPQIYAYLQLQIISASCDTATKRLNIQMSTDAGSNPTYDTTAGNYVGFTMAGATAAAITDASLIQTADVAAANNHTVGLNILGYNSLGHTTVAGRVSNGSTNYSVHCTYINQTNPVRAIRVFWNGGGNFDAGTYVLSGIA